MFGGRTIVLPPNCKVSTVRSLLVKAYVEKNAQVIYDGLKGIFENTAYARGGGYPTEVLLVGDRCVYLWYNSNNKEVDINVYKAGDVAHFDSWMANKRTDAAMPMFLDFDLYSLIHEPNRW